MRKEFAQELLKHAKKDKKIILITADLGWGMWNEFMDTLPEQFYNTGASEQAAMGMAVGLALEGYKPFVYSITTFLLYRPFEWIRNYINGEKIPVRLVGSGRDKDYHVDGFSHDATDAPTFLHHFRNIEAYYPKEKEDIPQFVERMVTQDRPSFISLRR